MSRLPGRVEKSAKWIAVTQDFSGGLTDEDFSNLAHSLIHNIANLEDHLRKWASHNGKDKSLVDKTFKGSFELKVIKDLSNNDKHGYPPRQRSHSGRAPKLVNPRRILRLTTGATKGSSVAVTLGPDDRPIILGTGSGLAILTGDVVDDKDDIIGDLDDIANKAVEDWAGLLSAYGVEVNLVAAPYQMAKERHRGIDTLRERIAVLETQQSIDVEVRPERGVETCRRDEGPIATIWFILRGLRVTNRSSTAAVSLGFEPYVPFTKPGFGGMPGIYPHSDTSHPDYPQLDRRGKPMLRNPLDVEAMKSEVGDMAFLMKLPRDEADSLDFQHLRMEMTDHVTGRRVGFSPTYGYPPPNSS